MKQMKSKLHNFSQPSVILALLLLGVVYAALFASTQSIDLASSVEPTIEHKKVRIGSFKADALARWVTGVLHNDDPVEPKSKVNRPRRRLSADEIRRIRDARPVTPVSGLRG